MGIMTMGMSGHDPSIEEFLRKGNYYITEAEIKMEHEHVAYSQQTIVPVRMTMNVRKTLTVSLVQTDPPAPKPKRLSVW